MHELKGDTFVLGWDAAPAAKLGAIMAVGKTVRLRIYPTQADRDMNRNHLVTVVQGTVGTYEMTKHVMGRWRDEQMRRLGNIDDQAE